MPAKKRYYAFLTIARKVPPGKFICHNPVNVVRPDQVAAENGFRFWSANRAWMAENPHFEVCDCGWAPWLPEHYSALPIIKRRWLRRRAAAAKVRTVKKQATRKRQRRK